MLELADIRCGCFAWVLWWVLLCCGAKLGVDASQLLQIPCCVEVAVLSSFGAWSVLVAMVLLT